jgi:hypothetical protein
VRPKDVLQRETGKKWMDRRSLESPRLALALDLIVLCSGGSALLQQDQAIVQGPRGCPTSSGEVGLCKFPCQIWTSRQQTQEIRRTWRSGGFAVDG